MELTALTPALLATLARQLPPPGTTHKLGLSEDQTLCHLRIVKIHGDGRQDEWYLIEGEPPTEDCWAFLALCVLPPGHMIPTPCVACVDLYAGGANKLQADLSFQPRSLADLRREFAGQAPALECPWLKEPQARARDAAQTLLAAAQLALRQPDVDFEDLLSEGPWSEEQRRLDMLIRAANKPLREVLQIDAWAGGDDCLPGDADDHVISGGDLWEFRDTGIPVRVHILRGTPPERAVALLRKCLAQLEEPRSWHRLKVSGIEEEDEIPADPFANN